MQDNISEVLNYFVLRWGNNLLSPLMLIIIISSPLSVPMPIMIQKEKDGMKALPTFFSLSLWESTIH